MPKVSLGQYTEKNINFARAIEACMKRKGMNSKSLIQKIKVGYTTHYARLKDPDSMKLGELRAYIRILDMPEEDVLNALYLNR